MVKPAQIRGARRRARSEIGTIGMSACRVQEQGGPEGYIVVFEGDPVLLGTFPPTVSVGGLSPTLLRGGPGNKVAVALIPGRPSGAEATIDYGFTKATCPIEAGTGADKRLFAEVMRMRRPRRTIVDRLRKLLRGLLRKG